MTRIFAILTMTVATLGFVGGCAHGSVSTAGGYGSSTGSYSSFTVTSGYDSPHVRWRSHPWYRSHIHRFHFPNVYGHRFGHPSLKSWHHRGLKRHPSWHRHRGSIHRNRPFRSRPHGLRGHGSWRHRSK